MSEFLLPSNEEAIITLTKTDFSLNIEVIDIYDEWKKAGDSADKSDGKDWIPYFIKTMKEKFDVDLNRTSAVLLVEQAVVKLNAIKKSCSPEPKQ
jgi:hypothetical protein